MVDNDREKGNDEGTTSKTESIGLIRKLISCSQPVPKRSTVSRFSLAANYASNLDIRCWPTRNTRSWNQTARDLCSTKILDNKILIKSGYCTVSTIIRSTRIGSRVTPCPRYIRKYLLSIFSRAKVISSMSIMEIYNVLVNNNGSIMRNDRTQRAMIRGKYITYIWIFRFAGTEHL